ncbi:DUF3566 domain-containing protein [Lysobacter korlensis]|uniref:DUF3566 domain-containing protein n=1 Tax=Lysobacter korlensis TaxID=553636 RepID=A0ABV6RTN2_9GAMM
MSSVAERLQRKTTKSPSAKQVRLKLVYIDFWSALKLSFLVSLCFGIALVVSTFLIWVILNSTSVFAQLDAMLTDIIGNDFSLTDTIGLPQVMMFALIVALLNVVSVTVLGAVISMLYNLSVRLTGGLLVGFTNT